ncbi:MAG: PQQ-binding-like beta-propeller repeat protein, partial [Bacteroidetes bacterium]|nr:PQQ-binding-like beta-propeller repeat protein [Fibrella sp.]
SASTLALDPETGAIKAHYKTTPYDAWDYDGVNELVLADLPMNGKTTPVMMKADRNGFFYVIDRSNMKVLSAEKFVKTNWADKVDMGTGRPSGVEKYRLTSKNTVKDVWPSFIGGKNWQQMSYSPKTGLVYIPANQIGMDFKGSDVAYQRGYFFLGAEWSMTYDADKMPGEYIAWDPIKQKKVWSIPQKFPIPGGALTTAGNLLFFGNMEGKFNAVDATTGKQMWSFNAGTGVGAAPMTYSVDGKQYVAVVTGRPTIIPGFIGGKLGEDIVKATPAGGSLLVFALQQ